MNLETAYRMARAEMDKHKLQGWDLMYDNAKSRFGCCWHNKCVITLSRYQVERHEEADVKDTILHEIAHALVGYEHGHNAVWRDKAISIGCSGKRTFDDTFVNYPNHATDKTIELQTIGVTDLTNSMSHAILTKKGETKPVKTEALQDVLRSTDIEFLKEANRSVVRRINDLMEIESLKAKANFLVGDKVKWESRKRGHEVTGVIEKINRKFIVVRQDKPEGSLGLHTRWNVTPNLLVKI